MEAKQIKIPFCGSSERHTYLASLDSFGLGRLICEALLLSFTGDFDFGDVEPWSWFPKSY